MVHSRWREEASFETLSRAGHSVCAWEGKLLVFGGERMPKRCRERAYSTALCRTPTHSSINPSPEPVVLDGWLAGRMSSTFFADVWAYDPSARTWELWCERWPHAPRRLVAEQMNDWIVYWLLVCLPEWMGRQVFTCI
jgi:hypothetical protein